MATHIYGSLFSSSSALRSRRRRHIIYAASTKTINVAAPHKLPAITPVRVSALSSDPAAAGAAVGEFESSVDVGSAEVFVSLAVEEEDKEEEEEVEEEKEDDDDELEDSLVDEPDVDADDVSELAEDWLLVVELGSAVRLESVCVLFSSVVVLESAAVEVRVPMTTGSVKVCTGAVIGTVTDGKPTVAPVATERTVVASSEAVPQPNCEKPPSYMFL